MRETGGLELASTITLILQANRLTKCASHPEQQFFKKHKFSVKHITVTDVAIVIKNMPIDKASDGNVPINLLNQSGVTNEKLKDYKNNVITNGSS